MHPHKRMEIINTVLDWYRGSPLKIQYDFRTCSFDALILYHDSLGRDIRNHFKLWEEVWTPELINGVDYSEAHPDSVSMRIIEEVWRKVNAS